MLYYKFSNYLKELYGEKVYKIPINIVCSCPNRDGTKDTKGCIFCGDDGAGFETIENSIPIKIQLQKNIEYMGTKYKSKKFIAYFQNYSNTYLPINQFKYNIEQVITDKRVCAIYIATRPDCIFDEHCVYLKNIKDTYHIDIVVEFGLQSTNDDTLLFLNRHHTFSDFKKGVELLKKYNLEVCAHMINDIPTESIDDVINSAKELSILGVNQVKCHSLYVLKNTQLGYMYENNEITLLELEDFIDRTIVFLEHLDKNIVVQRLIGRAPKEKTLFCNFGRNWRYIVDKIEKQMILKGSYQGSKVL